MRRDSKSLPAFLRWLLLAAALAVSACSTGVRIGYAHADTLVLYTIDGYVGLTPEQEQLVRERAAALAAWHRATQLRDYAQLLESVRRQIEGPVTAADVLAFTRGINARLLTLGERAAPDLAQLALTLTPDQLARLQHKLAGENAKARRELTQFSGVERLEERVKKVEERASFWFGSLTREQLELVRVALAHQPGNSSWWVDERERRNRDLLVVLRRIQAERPPEAVATEWLRTYFEQLQNPLDAERRREAELFRMGNAELIAQLINSATPEQRATLSRRLDGFAEDFIALASGRALLPPG